jgi:hypothetical protein
MKPPTLAAALCLAFATSGLSAPLRPPTTAPTSRPATKPADDYVVYAERSRKVMAAFDGLDKALRAGKLPPSDDYVKAMQEILPAWNAWADGLTEEQRDYPSAEALKVAAKTYKKAALMLAFADNLPRPKPDDDPAVAAAVDDAILKAQADVLDLRDAAKASTTQAGKLIRSREGTRPVLPKPPPE